MADDTLIALATETGIALQQAGWTLTLAESCTGGLAAATITAVPGSSAWFDRGFVTYSNAAKQELLDVPAAVLGNAGAVSEPAARAMAEGALLHSHAQISAAITGIAGPDGGTPDKPVGTVCFAWATRNGLLLSETRLFSGDRETVRRQSVEVALRGVLRLTLMADL